MAAARFKRSLFGYHRSSVEEAMSDAGDELADAKLAGAKSEAALVEVRGELDYTRFSLVEARKESDERANRVRELEAVVAWLADRVVDRERELRAVRAEPSGGEGVAEAVSDAEVEPEALPAPDPLPADLPTGRRERVEAAVREASDRNEATAEAARAEVEAAGSAADPPDRFSAAPSGVPGSAEHERMADGAPVAVASAGAGEATAERLWEGRVALEIGPLSDFSQLAGFEDAAGGISGARDISVRRFSKGRATLQLSLERPIDLLAELESRAPLEFTVRDTRADRVVLDVERD